MKQPERPPDPGRRQLWLDGFGEGRHRVRIPYVAAWSSEMAFRVVKHDEIGPVLVSSGQRGWGAPVLGKMDPHRQREVVSNGWCQVCATPLPDGPRFAVFVSAQPAPGWVHPSTGEAHDTVRLVEPWACTRCLVHAIEECPGIARSAQYVIKLRRWATELARVKTAPYIDDDDRRTVDGQIAESAWGNAKIVPLLFKMIPLAEFTARAKRRRGRS